MISISARSSGREVVAAGLVIRLDRLAARLDLARQHADDLVVGQRRGGAFSAL